MLEDHEIALVEAFRNLPPVSTLMELSDRYPDAVYETKIPNATGLNIGIIVFTKPIPEVDSIIIRISYREDTISNVQTVFDKQRVRMMKTDEQRYMITYLQSKSVFELHRDYEPASKIFEFNKDEVVIVSEKYWKQGKLIELDRSAYDDDAWKFTWEML